MINKILSAEISQTSSSKPPLLKNELVWVMCPKCIFDVVIYNIKTRYSDGGKVALVPLLETSS